MGTFDNLFTGATQKNATGKFDDLFSSKKVPMKEPINGSPSFTFKTGEPIDLKKVSVPKIEPIDSTPSISGPISGDIVAGATNVIKHPIIATVGVVKGATDVFISGLSGSLNLAGKKDWAKSVELDKKEVNRIFEENAKSVGAEQAGHIGEFVGEQIPYILTGELAVEVGASVVGAGLAKYGGKLSTKAIETIGKATKWASDTAGFIGLHQLTIDPEQESRSNAIKTDALVLAALGGVGLVGSAIKDARMQNEIRNFVDEIPSKSSTQLETESKALLNEVKTTTGREPKELVGETLREYPIDLKKIPLKTKMGDVLEQARMRGYPYEGTEFGKTQLTKIIPTELGKEVPKPPIISEISKVPTTIESTATEVIGGVKVPSEGKIKPYAPEIPTETKISGLAKGVEAKALENKLTKGFGDLPEYQVVNKAEQATKAIDILKKDIEQAKRIAMGTELPPKGVLPESVFIAVEEHATKTGDIELLRKLATNSDITTQATAMGQRISMLAERNPESTLSNIQTVVKQRIKDVESKIGKTVTKAKQEVATEIKTKIKKPVPTKETWAKFIDDITC